MGRLLRICFHVLFNLLKAIWLLTLWAIIDCRGFYVRVRRKQEQMKAEYQIFKREQIKKDPQRYWNPKKMEFNYTSLFLEFIFSRH